MVNSDTKSHKLPTKLCRLYSENSYIVITTPPKTVHNASFALLCLYRSGSCCCYLPSLTIQSKGHASPTHAINEGFSEKCYMRNPWKSFWKGLTCSVVEIGDCEMFFVTVNFVFPKRLGHLSCFV